MPHLGSTVSPMTCREEVVEAFEVLHRTTGEPDFSPAQVVAEVRRAGSSYTDSTIRTHVVAHMFEDGTLVRAARGVYRLARHRDRIVAEAATPNGEILRLTEDQVKTSVAAWLQAAGWSVQVRWGRDRGIDINARRGTERWAIEAKGEAPAGPQQVNYFLNALGEIMQRMDDASAHYGLALPDHRQYRGLVERLPLLARQRMRLTVLFVDERGEVSLVEPPI